MLIVTSEAVAGREIADHIGLVRGSTIRVRHIGSDIVASLRNIVGGEVPEYTRLMAGAREQALDRMIQEAQTLGADAIVAVRFTTSMVMQGGAEILAYGTAVRFKSHG